MVNTSIDLDLNLRDLIAIINDFQLSGGKFLLFVCIDYLTHTILGPVDELSVIAALVATSNAKRVAHSMTGVGVIVPSHSELDPEYVQPVPPRSQSARCAIPPHVVGAATRLNSTEHVKPALSNVKYRVPAHVATTPESTSSGSASYV